MLAASSGVSRVKLSRGANHSSDARREQMEQLQDIALSISPSTSNATWPQWQLPLYFMALTSLGVSVYLFALVIDIPIAGKGITLVAQGVQRKIDASFFFGFAAQAAENAI